MFEMLPGFVLTTLNVMANLLVVAIGSTRDLRPVGTPMFVACPFPTLDEDAQDPAPVTIGPTCEKPYTQDHIFNISGTSYGAQSCGVQEPRRLKRYHVRIQSDNGKSIPLDQLWPYPKPGEALKAPAKEVA